MEIKDFEFTDKETEESFIQKIKDKFIDVNELTPHICSWLKNNAEDLVDTILNIAPNGDYSKLISEPDEMVKFVKEVCCNPEVWKCCSMSEKGQLFKFEFKCTAIDDGDKFFGIVMIGKESKKVRHAFVQK